MDKEETKLRRVWQFGYESKPNYWEWSREFPSLKAMAEQVGEWEERHPEIKVLTRNSYRRDKLPAQ